MNLYKVTFGKPDGSTSNYFNDKNYHIIAETHNQAIKKALYHVENIEASEPPKSVLVYDGSLNTSNEPDYSKTLKFVLLLAEDVIM
jgi:hypothetical protein